MAKTDLQLKTLAQATGAKMTTSITYVNPNANSATLKEFGQKLNALTTNTYVETNRVQTINVDTEDTPKTIPNFTLKGTTYNRDTHITLPSADFDTPSTGTIFGIAKYTYNSSINTVPIITTDNNEVVIRTGNASHTGTFTLNLAITETEIYTAATTTTTINVT